MKTNDGTSSDYSSKASFQTPKLWKDTAAPEVLSNLDTNEAKRQQVIWELFNTEDIYLKDIKTIIDVFMNPILDRKIISTKNVDIIFSNLESIYKVNSVLLLIHI